MTTAVVAIVGPTASGKSDTALALAERLNGVIIGADSVQVYRGFDIGSAKPTSEERARVTHELVDVVEPDEDFTAADYARLADEAIARTQAAGRLPIVVGGTGFYFRALIEGLIEAPGRNDEVRSRLSELDEAALRRRLAEIDPARERAIAARDRFRLIRALEIFETSGRTPSEWAAVQAPAARYNVFWLGLSSPRELLYRRIDARVERMWAAGWPEEVQGLVEKGYAECRPMQSVGYAEVYAYLRGTLPENEAMALARRRTRRYAKRQLTWFRANRQVDWSDPLQTDNVDRLLRATETWLRKQD